MTLMNYAQKIQKQVKVPGNNSDEQAADNGYKCLSKKKNLQLQTVRRAVRDKLK